MFNLSKIQNTQIIAKLLAKLRKRWWYKKDIVVLFGNKGICLSAFIRGKLIESMFIPFEDAANLNLHKTFFYKFKNFDVFFLLDSLECKMRHDLIPILKSLVKTNPIEQFINGYFNKEDIIAYYVYNRVTTPNEAWSTLIMSSPYHSPLSDIIENIFEQRRLNFRGIYFLALEFKTIVNKIIQTTEQNKYANHFQICVFILEASGIKFIIKHQENIISMRTFEYPLDKSESYIQGIIEQELNDCLLLYKNYIENLKNEVCIIFIVENALQVLLKQTNFENHPVIFVPSNAVLTEIELIPSKFLDVNVSKLFVKYKQFRAINTYLKSIEKLNFIASLIVKLFGLGMLILLLTAGVIKYKISQNNKKSLFFSEKYYATTQNYNDIKSKYPYIKNTTNLADLYVAEKLLQAPVVLPFKLLEKLIANLDPAFKIKEIKWELMDVDNILLMSKRQLGIKILLNFTTNNLSVKDALKILNNHVKHIHDNLSNKGGDFTIVISKNKITNISGRVVIPLFIKYNRKG